MKGEILVSEPKIEVERTIDFRKTKEDLKTRRNLISGFEEAVDIIQECLEDILASDEFEINVSIREEEFGLLSLIVEKIPKEEDEDDWGVKWKNSNLMKN